MFQPEPEECRAHVHAMSKISRVLETDEFPRRGSSRMSAPPAFMLGRLPHTLLMVGCAYPSLSSSWWSSRGSSLGKGGISVRHLLASPHPIHPSLHRSCKIPNYISFSLCISHLPVFPAVNHLEFLHLSLFLVTRVPACFLVVVGCW